MNTPKRVEHQLTDKGYVPVYTTAVVEQPWADYSAVDHEVWARLFARQQQVLVGRAIRGVPGTFTGTVDRLDSRADPITRQVTVFVSLPNTGGALIAGLFAEGRVETTSREGVIVPLAAVNETGVEPFVTRITTGAAERVPVKLGVRQADTEEVEVLEGVASGDLLILGSAMAVAPGTPVAVAE